MTRTRFVVAMVAIVVTAALAACGDKGPPSLEKMVEALEATGFARFTGDSVKLQGPVVMGETGWEAELTQTQLRALQATGVTEEQFNRGIAALRRDDEYARRVTEAYKSH